jgi:hypothetical protein
VRGDLSSEYHNDVLQRAKRELRVLPRCSTLCLDPLGGGRIEHDIEAGTVKVFGFSQAFGPAVHEVATQIIRRAFPWYGDDTVQASYEGY